MRNEDPTGVLRRKAARAHNGLAPEDETLAQAQHTAELQGSDTYVARWLAFQESWHGRTATAEDQEAVKAACTCGVRSPRVLQHHDYCASYGVPFTGYDSV